MSGYVDPQTRYERTPDGWVRFSSEDWAQISAWMDRHLTQDLRRNGTYPLLEKLAAHVFAAAATEPVALPGSDLGTSDGGPRHAGITMMADPTRKPLTVREAAARRGSSERLIRRMCKTGVIKAQKPGWEWQIDPDQFPIHEEE